MPISVKNLACLTINIQYIVGLFQHEDYGATTGCGRKKSMLVSEAHFMKNGAYQVLQVYTFT